MATAVGWTPSCTVVMTVLLEVSITGTLPENSTVGAAGYSSRSATTGSTLAAARAGTQAETNAITAKSAADDVNIGTSNGETPNRNVRMNRIRALAAIKP